YARRCADTASAMDGGAIEETARKLAGAACNRIALAFSSEHDALEVLQPQVILELARIFKQIHLGVAVRSQANVDAVLKVFGGRHNTIAKISLRSRTGAHHCA